MTDADLFALTVWTEAAGEPYEGKVAVARVILNRIAQRYESDGTMAGSVLKFDQFSDFWFDMVDGAYARVCDCRDEAERRAEAMLPRARTQPIWADCARATADGAPGSGFRGGPQWARLAAEPRALLYCDPTLSRPAWATPGALVAAIFHHSFYRA
jgi:spore germination cell wall hydrolase CwlJ-like protein